VGVCSSSPSEAEGEEDEEEEEEEEDECEEERRGGGGRGTIIAVSRPGARRRGRESMLWVEAKRRCVQRQW
jgi:hypothetical protein